MDKTQFEVEVPTIDTSSSKRTITKTINYNLTHDKVRRHNVPSQKNGYADIRC